MWIVHPFLLAAIKIRDWDLKIYQVHNHWHLLVALSLKLVIMSSLSFSSSTIFSRLGTALAHNNLPSMPCFCIMVRTISLSTFPGKSLRIPPFISRVLSWNHELRFMSFFFSSIVNFLKFSLIIILRILMQKSVVMKVTIIAWKVRYPQLFSL